MCIVIFFHFDNENSPGLVHKRLQNVFFFLALCGCICQQNNSILAVQLLFCRYFNFNAGLQLLWLIICVIAVSVAHVLGIVTMLYGSVN
jgi:hypothetical protein